MVPIRTCQLTSQCQQAPIPELPPKLIPESIRLLYQAPVLTVGLHTNVFPPLVNAILHSYCLTTTEHVVQLHCGFKIVLRGPLISDHFLSDGSCLFPYNS